MSSSNIPPVLRGILRRLRVNKTDHLSKPSLSQIIDNDTTSATRKYVLNWYRRESVDHNNNNANNNNNNNKEEERLHKLLANEYLSLRENIDERTRLQQLDAGAEKQFSPKEMSRRAAARAGLQMPDLDPDLKR
jgi:hypothetical protein